MAVANAPEPQASRSLARDDQWVVVAVVHHRELSS
jgi:hypothetical protein